jgi:hypothetical protein
MKINVIIISLLLCTIFSCEKDNSSIGFEPGPPGSFSYLSYDSLGAPVVSGWLKIEMTDSVSIEGSWQLKKLINRDDLGPQFGEGELIGHIEDSSISMELNPQFRDHNLGLVGTISNTRIDGKWYWVSFPGVTNWGTFKAVKN